MMADYIIPNDKLLKDLESQDFHTRWFAAEVLGTKRDLSDQEIEKVKTLARTSDVGEVLVWGLGMMRAVGAETLIGEFLTHPNNYYRWRAAEALRDLGTDLALTELEKGLKQGDEETRWKCAWAIGEIGNISSFEVLWSVAENDKDRYVRWKSIWGITRLKGNVEELVKTKMTTSNLSRFMNWRAAWVLGRIGNAETILWLENYRQKPNVDEYINYQISIAIETINKRIANEK